MRVPSGDQAGSQFSPTLSPLVTSSSVPWKMFEMKMFGAAAPGTTCRRSTRPSGDQRGAMFSVLPTVTRR